ARLANLDEDTPVIFALDQEDRNQQVWGFTKLSGNTSRYGLPDGMLDRGYMYLGSIENLLEGSPTDPQGQAVEQGSCDPEEAKEALSGDIYTALSRETLCDVQENARGEPVIVAAQAFNRDGFNAEAAAATESDASFGDATVWAVAGGEVTVVAGGQLPAAEGRDGDSSPLHLLRVVFGFLLLVLPGALAFRFFVADGDRVAEGLGMVPALSLLLTSLMGVVVVAALRAPFDAAVAWTTLALTVLLCAGLRWFSRRRTSSA
ncbi:MAG: hypothetical protein ACRDJL_08275, partial [Actinomycetota bacterium]